MTNAVFSRNSEPETLSDAVSVFVCSPNSCAQWDGSRRGYFGGPLGPEGEDFWSKTIS